MGVFFHFNFDNRICDHAPHAPAPDCRFSPACLRAASVYCSTPAGASCDLSLVSVRTTPRVVINCVYIPHSILYKTEARMRACARRKERKTRERASALKPDVIIIVRIMSLNGARSDLIRFGRARKAHAHAAHLLAQALPRRQCTHVRVSSPQRRATHARFARLCFVCA